MRLTPLVIILFSSISISGKDITTASATLNSNEFQGTVKFTRLNDITEIELDFDSIPNISGETPYTWYIHDKPVNSTGSCDSTGLHLDPEGVNPEGKNADYKCDSEDAEKTCMLGDLAGKFGDLDPEQKGFSFSDPDLELTGKDGIIGRSIVIHLKNSTRIVCANIV
jgi:Cu/Zn superoxide dismutase